ncbi:hypothetical protein BCR32DRAFT_277783 [Anaeromyces robustus]|uniref:Uncharacterized protein n=1 Tax=Anaeromyces robustus TaxID=1754192 RepID=A0A1Y1XE28_9FUNG|nr:hypothetical protein BCR32DRAFT_277783 [Anaeromyces robustus]|eukprot:ORX83706.1 hypothetical protein BCR32DRAFT_277783 [Anaeromyces robustus]
MKYFKYILITTTVLSLNFQNSFGSPITEVNDDNNNLSRRGNNVFVDFFSFVGNHKQNNNNKKQNKLSRRNIFKDFFTFVGENNHGNVGYAPANAPTEDDIKEDMERQRIKEEEERQRKAEEEKKMKEKEEKLKKKHKKILLEAVRKIILDKSESLGITTDSIDSDMEIIEKDFNIKGTRFFRKLREKNDEIRNKESGLSRRNYCGGYCMGGAALHDTPTYGKGEEEAFKCFYQKMPIFGPIIDVIVNPSKLKEGNPVYDFFTFIGKNNHGRVGPGGSEVASVDDVRRDEEERKEQEENYLHDINALLKKMYEMYDKLEIDSDFINLNVKSVKFNLEKEMYSNSLDWVTETQDCLISKLSEDEQESMKIYKVIRNAVIFGTTFMVGYEDIAQNFIDGKFLEGNISVLGNTQEMLDKIFNALGIDDDDDKDDE